MQNCSKAGYGSVAVDLWSDVEDHSISSLIRSMAAMVIKIRQFAIARVVKFVLPDLLWPHRAWNHDGKDSLSTGPYISWSRISCCTVCQPIHSLREICNFLMSIVVAAYIANDNNSSAVQYRGSNEILMRLHVTDTIWRTSPRRDSQCFLLSQLMKPNQCMAMVYT
jgi:hypothetical protein